MNPCSYTWQPSPDLELLLLELELMRGWLGTMRTQMSYTWRRRRADAALDDMRCSKCMRHWLHWASVHCIWRWISTTTLRKRCIQHLATAGATDIF